MAAMADAKLTKTLTTTLHLLDHFTNSLTSLPPEGTAQPPNTPSPPNLLSTCATTLRAQTTKLSLLIITPPFTPSAIYTVVASLNDAILPSLLTATLLLTPSNFTKAYSAEAISLTKATLRDLKPLIHLVETRSQDGKPKADPTAHQKSGVTEATGKIWEDCDELFQLADGGIASFAVKKAEQYLELIKDAVKEIEEWDPEDDDDDYDSLFDDNQAETPPTEDTHEKPTTPPSSTPHDIAQIKLSTLKILNRLPQSLHVVIHQRLKQGLPPTPFGLPQQILILDNITSKMEQTSTCIDDVAERLYTHDALGAMLTVEKARACVVEIVEGVMVAGWDDASAVVVDGHEEGTKKDMTRVETKEDRYVKRALEWVKSAGTTNEDVIQTRMLRSLVA